MGDRDTKHVSEKERECRVREPVCGGWNGKFFCLNEDWSRMASVIGDLSAKTWRA